MWPWEHAAAGYLLYSLALRVLGKEPPSDTGAWLLLFGTQLPDLIDKPLSWGLGVFPTGYALGHSVFFAVPVGAAMLAAAMRVDRRRLGIAFVVGYWSHLVTDVLNPLRHGGAPLPERVLWPVVPGTPYERDLGIGRGVTYVTDFLDALGAMDPVTLVVAYLLVPFVTVVLWIRDGAPGLALVGRVVTAVSQPKR